MATRNLTDVFMLMRNNANQNRNLFSEQTINDRMALVESGEMMELNKSSLPPIWINVLEEAQFQMSRIQKKLNDLSQQQQAYLSKPSLDESSERETNIENLTQDITKVRFSYELNTTKVKLKKKYLGAFKKPQTYCPNFVVRFWKLFENFVSIWKSLPPYVN